MLLNRLFIWMFIVGIVTVFVKIIFWGDLLVAERVVNGLFEQAKAGFELALFITGALCFWMGIMKVGEMAGAIEGLSKAFAPLFRQLFPEIPQNHPAIGSIMMNFSANMLGLDNAATPLGLKAMNQLQELNPDPERATNAQIMFLVLNTSGLTLIPVSILAYRSAENSMNPSEVFVPILLATACSTLAGLLLISLKQKINLFKISVLSYLSVFIGLIGVLLYFSLKSAELASNISSVGGNAFILLILLVFILLAWRRKVNVYETFIEGAKSGFGIAVTIIPYLVGILCAVALIRYSGVLDALIDVVRSLVLAMGVYRTEFVDALPVGLMKPFSGSGARGLMLEIFKQPQFGVDSLVGKIAATMQGSTETTFYVLALYFGSVGVKNTRYAAGAGLFCDLVGIIAAIYFSYLFYS